MIILIPLGGAGFRFSQNNYTMPKPLVKVKGKSIICWLLDNLVLPHNTHVCIPYNKHLQKYRIEDILRKEYPNINFVFECIQSDTKGAVETIKHGLKKLERENVRDSCVICLDGDNFYNIDIVSKWNKQNQIFVFEDNTERSCFSFVRFEEITLKLIEIVEKDRISNFGCTGGYGFESWKSLQKMCDYITQNDITSKGEYYTSILVNEMNKQEEFTVNVLEKSQFICLGTPVDVRMFCQNAAENYQVKKRYCFDLDNTLVSFPEVYGDYTTVKPIPENISILRKLHKANNTIIIYTARRMHTCYGNVGKVVKNIAKITIETLERFNIPYDELYFGKPHADFYIDDLAVSCNLDLEKELGIYNTDLIIRDFNRIQEVNTIQVFRKTSNDLEGEIYYYNHIPNAVRDMFPVMIKYDKNNKWYDVEKINGITSSKLFLSSQLGVNELKLILDKLHYLHSLPVDHSPSELNIFDNYTNKLRNRYKNFDYSFLPRSDDVYKELIGILQNYENSGIAQTGVIHGDCVLTNIMIDIERNIKFIDMRGQINNHNTIYGDVMYDWAKMYQSLIGYDEIQEHVSINTEYRTKLLNLFENYIQDIFGNDTLYWIKQITKSLLFSLIPLHYSPDNIEKCTKYYNLIFTI